MGAYLSLSRSGRRGGVGWGWGVCLFEDGRLFEVGANSSLGAYSNKYGNSLSLQMVQKNHANLK